MRIFLIGYMGSGKSTLGKKLASKLGYKFIDMDSCIEQQHGAAITDIFRDKGEEFFRMAEREFIRSFVEDDVVVSTGGGTPCFYDNMDVINNLGISVYLRVPPPVLASRLIVANSSRPLIANKNVDDLELFIKENINKREKDYLKSTHTIEGIGINVNDIINVLNFNYEK